MTRRVSIAIRIENGTPVLMQVVTAGTCSGLRLKSSCVEDAALSSRRRARRLTESPGRDFTGLRHPDTGAPTNRVGDSLKPNARHIHAQKTRPHRSRYTRFSPRAFIRLFAY